MTQKRTSLFILVITLAGLALASFAALMDGQRYGHAPNASFAVLAQGILPVSDSLAWITTDSVIAYRMGLDNPYFMSGGGGTGYLYFEARGTATLPQQETRLPLNLSLVIDRSGSMAGEKLEYAKEAAIFLVDQMKQEDYLSLVIYDTSVELLVGQMSAGAREKFKSAIRGISPGSGTNLCGGLQMGLDQLDQHYRSGYVNRVLLMSDGLANEGIVDPLRIAGIASSYSKEKGITVSTFGVGLGFNEDLMTSVAESGSGSYYFIARPGDIPGIVSRELQGLMATVAQNAHLSFTLPEGVELEKVFGYAYELHDRQVEIRFREIAAGEVKSVLVRFRYHTDVAGTNNFLATLQYNDAVHQGIFRSGTWKGTTTATTDSGAYDQGFNQQVREQVVLFEANERMEQAMHAADDGDYDKARQLVLDNSMSLQKAISSGYSSGYLIQQDSINTYYLEQLKRAEDMGEMEVNEMQKNNKSMNYEVRKKK